MPEVFIKVSYTAKASSFAFEYRFYTPRIAKNSKTRFFYGLYFNKTWFLTNQSARRFLSVL